MIESDFYSTAAGREHFRNQLQSIRYCVQEAGFDYESAPPCALRSRPQTELSHRAQTCNFVSHTILKPTPVCVKKCRREWIDETLEDMDTEERRLYNNQKNAKSRRRSVPQILHVN